MCACVRVCARKLQVCPALQCASSRCGSERDRVHTRAHTHKPGTCNLHTATLAHCNASTATLPALQCASGLSRWKRCRVQVPSSRCVRVCACVRVCVRVCACVCIYVCVYALRVSVCNSQASSQLPLHHTATHRNTLQRAATRCNTLFITKIHHPQVLPDDLIAAHELQSIATRIPGCVNTSACAQLKPSLLTNTPVGTRAGFYWAQTPTNSTVLLQDGDARAECAWGGGRAWFAAQVQDTATHCNTLQHSGSRRRCKALQHIAVHCSTLQRTAAHCISLQHTAAHCSTLQHTATHTATPLIYVGSRRRCTKILCLRWGA